MREIGWQGQGSQAGAAHPNDLRMFKSDGAPGRGDLGDPLIAHSLSRRRDCTSYISVVITRRNPTFGKAVVGRQLRPGGGAIAEAEGFLLAS